MSSDKTIYQYLLITIVLSLLIPTTLYAGEKILLQWKIPESGLYYKTDLSQIDPKVSFFEFDFDLLDSKKQLNEKAEKKISKLQFPDNMNMVSVIENTDDQKIKTTSYFQNWQMPEEIKKSSGENSKELRKFTELMNTQPQLEGVINEKGKIESFYLPQSQKNLLALMYELPDHPVQVGDTWNINMYCIHMGGGFSAEKAKRINHVELKDITTDESGNSIAVIHYMHTEIVTGTMLNPMTKQKIPIKMTCSYMGRHEFFITKGYWKSINGEMSITSEGMMKSKTKQKIAMLPISKLPAGIKHK